MSGDEVVGVRFRTPGAYFYGYEFGEFVARRALVRLGKYLGHGLCYETAAMVMLTLRNNQSAKIVHGFSTANDGERCSHAWVELRNRGRDLVVSPTWTHDWLIKKEVYYGEELKIFPEPVWTCSYKKFWNQPVSKKLYELTRNPETSFGILPMLLYYRPNDYNSPTEFGFFFNHEERDLHQLRNLLIDGEFNGHPIGYQRPITAEIVAEVGIEGRSSPSIEAQVDVYTDLTTFEHHHKLP